MSQNYNCVLEKNKVLCDAYIAPINDQVIIGAGLLDYLHCKIDYGAHSVSINGQEIPVVFQRGVDGTDVEVSKVRMVKRVVIPPNTLVRVNCRTSVPLHGDVVFNPKKVHKNLLIPNGLCSLDDNEEFVIEILNDSPFFCTLKKDEHVGSCMRTSDVFDFSDPPWMSAGPIVFHGIETEVTETAEDEAEECDKSSGEIPAVATIRGSPTAQPNTDENSCVPEHLVDLYSRSCEELDQEQAAEVAKLLTEYQDVFAKDEFDLGCFSEIQHRIDTGDSQPVRQRLRRTPLGFEDEEAKHLKKMLDAKIIEPSHSEYASAPVLVRKKDGSVRWCIDYRALNKATKKDSFSNATDRRMS